MKLDDIRGKIDEIDNLIIALLIERFHLAKEARKEKVSSGRSLRDETREQHVITRALKNAKNKLNEHFVKKIYSEIIAYSRKVQEE